MLLVCNVSLNKSSQASRVLHEEAEALAVLAAHPPVALDNAVAVLRNISGKVFTSGIGKSGYVAQKVASTLSCLGRPSVFLHPIDGLHGDLGAVGRDDALLLFSNSGHTKELHDLFSAVTHLGIPRLVVTSQKDSFLGTHADITLEIPSVPESCFLGLAPTTSVILMMALGDAIAVSLSSASGFSEREYKALHPHGSLGKRLKCVGDVARTNVPVVSQTASLKEAIIAVALGRLGCVGVIDKSYALVGELFANMFVEEIPLSQDIETVMEKPLVVSETASLHEALALMNEHGKPALFIVDGKRSPKGILLEEDCF